MIKNYYLPGRSFTDLFASLIIIYYQLPHAIVVKGSENLLLRCDAIRRPDVYGTGNAVNNYVIHCIEQLEAITDVQAMANVIFTFIDR